MSTRRSRALVIAAVAAAALGTACAGKRIEGPSRPGQAMIVLLEDAETGTTGHALASNPLGTVNLDDDRDSTRVDANLPPGPVTTLGGSDVRRIFGEALSALPPPARRFTVYFRFESNELTDQSRALLPTILKTVKERAVPDVAIVGHTDTSGAPDANFKLGLERAVTVRDLLVGAGLDPSFIEVTSHGEADLLIKTPDQTPEPRNRRVDIAVR